MSIQSAIRRVWDLCSVRMSPSETLVAAFGESDPAAEIAANRWTEPFEIRLNGETNPADAAKAIIENRRPGTTFRYTPDTSFRWEPMLLIFGARVDDDNDPLRDAEDMALAGGMRLWFDGDVCVIEPRPLPEPNRGMWEFDEETP